MGPSGAGKHEVEYGGADGRTVTCPPGEKSLGRGRPVHAPDRPDGRQLDLRRLARGQQIRESVEIVVLSLAAATEERDRRRAVRGRGLRVNRGCPRTGEDGISAFQRQAHRLAALGRELCERLVVPLQAIEERAK